MVGSAIVSFPHSSLISLRLFFFPSPNSLAELTDASLIAGVTGVDPNHRGGNVTSRLPTQPG